MQKKINVLREHTNYKKGIESYFLRLSQNGFRRDQMWCIAHKEPDVWFNGGGVGSNRKYFIDDEKPLRVRQL